MAKQKDPKDVMEGLVKELMECFRNTNHSKQFLAELMLGTIWLDVLVLRMSKTRNRLERRKMLNEFNSGVKTVRKGIELLWETTHGITAACEGRAAFNVE